MEFFNGLKSTCSLCSPDFSVAGAYMWKASHYLPYICYVGEVERDMYNDEIF